MIKTEIRVTTRGPVFNGAWRRIMDDLVDDIGREVAEEGVEDVRAMLDRSLRNPTGHYRSRIMRQGNRVTDSRVVYGPWLEGTGSRNKTTRFKGYRSFRRATQRLDARVPAIVTPVVHRAVARLNG